MKVPSLLTAHTPCLLNHRKLIAALTPTTIIIVNDHYLLKHQAVDHRYKRRALQRGYCHYVTLNTHKFFKTSWFVPLLVCLFPRLLMDACAWMTRAVGVKG